MTSIGYEHLNHVKPAETAPSKVVSTLAIVVLIAPVGLLSVDKPAVEPDFHGNSGSIAVTK